MDIRVMRYFLAIAQEENLTKAANLIHISQPSLSKQMKELEMELGKTLFIRGNRKITLTEDGMYFRKRAQEIVDLTDKMLVDLEVQDYDLKGDIHIGCGETTGMKELIATMKKVHDEYPDIHFHIHSGNGLDIRESVEKGLYDFGLFVGKLDFSKMETYPLRYKNIWGLICRKDDPLASLPYITKEQVCELPLITSRQGMREQILHDWLGKEKKDLNIVATYNLFYNAGFMVEQKLGYALSIDGLQQSHEDLVFIPFEPKLEAPLFLVWKKYQAFSKAAQKFLEAFKAGEAGEEGQ
ncbi:LysR family transcriptional regulator [Dubosiella muris]|uniref:LysR family transcriptional regulator n=3 Tax=Dubosiella TaxID=1937008 RepID=A0AC61RAQ4_9FIRM|nr:LysR family transcriptional regulator [Dubosiella muris]TGY66878.1 LysR family transcriptional regulator [Dubosiella muris]